MRKNRERERLGLLDSIGQVASLLAGSPDLEGFLERTVSMVAAHLDAGVCSIYLYDEKSEELVLRATVGLSDDVVGAVRLKLGEGLAGRALKELRPIYTTHASQDEDYQFVPGSGEEHYETYLAVPIRRGVEKVGVLVAQRPKDDSFTESDVAAMQALTSQLATAIENARVFLALSAGTVEVDPLRGVPEVGMSLIKGDPVSPGFAKGAGHVYRRSPAASVLMGAQESKLMAIPAPVSLDVAVARTVSQLDVLQESLGTRLPEAASLIFESHLLMLKDRSFVGKMRDLIEDDTPAQRAVASVASEYINLFEASAHDYMREKARDVEDLALRLLDNLMDEDDGGPPESEAHIVIARDLLPSDILRIALGNVQGIVLASGGATSHVSILVRSLQIPMVIANAPELLRIKEDALVLVDADVGNIYVSPSQEVLDRFEERVEAAKLLERHGPHMLSQSKTRDGHRVRLLANINLLSELDLALQFKAEGVGLYRTEFPFLVRPSLPSQQEQEVVYGKLLERMQGRPVTIRTLDAGGDKVLSHFDTAGEANPALGLRSTRFTLKYPDIFDQQLRAILRAASKKDQLSLMFPMIGSLDELIAARTRLDACIAEVEQSDGYCYRPRVGMMVEVPGVVSLADEFAQQVEFFSIGTNDFIQYMLAVDRMNENVAEYYCPHHPSVLRGIAEVMKAAKRHGVEVSVCGEMAHDPKYVPFFVGLGVDSLSVDPNSLPAVQQAVQAVTLGEAQDYAQLMLAATRVAEIEAVMDEAAGPAPAIGAHTLVTQHQTLGRHKHRIIGKHVPGPHRNPVAGEHGHRTGARFAEDH